MTDTIDRVLDEAVASGKLVGAVVMVAKDGQTLYHRALGLADREAGTPMAEDTVFRAASLTKPMVASTLLAMADKGLVRVDDPVSAYLPYFTPKLPDGRQPDITLKHLLTHTAGLLYDYSAKNPRLTNGLVNANIHLDELLPLMAEQELSYAPGTGWFYSMAIDVLGGVIAKVHGGPLRDAVSHYVTGPLGMNDTAFTVADRSRLAVPYADGVDQPTRMAEPQPVNNPWGGVTTFSPERIFNENAFECGGGGMATTGPDFMRFLNAILADGGPILAPETARAALKDQMGYEREPGQAFSFLGSYTVDPVRADLYWPAGTNNWGGIYGHIWSIDPVNRITMVSLSNTAFYGGELAFPRALRKAVYTDLI
ncbi:serine hydrolase domain-containing protein [Devosia sp. 63-57]|uniref:serine hydrolase domain-containing protein n=1 Tax=Devosia sp. 63-57 TaxID=1895751 RepID=UPI00257C39C6|nr:serine hydrolase domain-containing protein [Devosia sp. 63-57]